MAGTPSSGQSSEAAGQTLMLAWVFDGVLTSLKQSHYIAQTPATTRGQSLLH